VLPLPGPVAIPKPAADVGENHGISFLIFSAASPQAATLVKAKTVGPSQTRPRPGVLAVGRAIVEEGAERAWTLSRLSGGCWPLAILASWRKHSNRSMPG